MANLGHLIGADLGNPILIREIAKEFSKRSGGKLHTMSDEEVTKAIKLRPAIGATSDVGLLKAAQDNTRLQIAAQLKKQDLFKNISDEGLNKLVNEIDIGDVAQASISSNGEITTDAANKFFNSLKSSLEGTQILRQSIKDSKPEYAKLSDREIDAILGGSTIENVEANIQESLPQPGVEDPTSDIATQLEGARTSFAQELQQKRTMFEQESRAALEERAQAIPGLEGELRDLLNREFEEQLPDLIRQRGEEGVGFLRSGGFQSALAEEIGGLKEGVADKVAEFGLGQRLQQSEREFGIEQGIAELGATDADRVAAIGLGNVQSQADIQTNVYLQQLGFDQQMKALKQNFLNTNSLQQQQQAFQAQQNDLQRMFQQRQINQQVSAFEDQKHEQSSSAKRGALTSLGLTALGGIGGGLAAGGISGISGLQGGLLGAGILGGNPSLTTLGAGSALGLFGGGAGTGATSLTGTGTAGVSSVYGVR